MDALPLGDSRYAHLCGHHQQMTALFGAARWLKERAPALAARAAFIATPAEEFVDFDRREELRERGIVRWLSGKQELIERGVFRGFRWVVATHSARLSSGRAVNSVQRMNGFDVLRFSFKGKSAHAGASPHLGRNAQNAASLFLQACAFLREGFDEEKHIRIHPVMRLTPGQPINLVPEAAFAETYARGVDGVAIFETVGKLGAAAQGCGSALGIEVGTEHIRGYAPFAVDARLHGLLGAEARDRGVEFVEEPFSAASTDMGDVSRLVPSIILGLPGTNGLLHQVDFRTADEEAAYVFSAELLAGFIQRLLGAA